jgi:hypothetical protein
MRNLSLYLLLPFLLASCANPTANQRGSELESESTKDSPAEPEEGFMRIIGDLRWDNLTTAQDWVAVFHGCLKLPDPRSYFGQPANSASEQKPRHSNCKGIDIGEVTLYPVVVSTATNNRTPSGSMTTNVKFKVMDVTQKRAFKTAIENAYMPSLTEEGKYCSSYTCWSEVYDGFWAAPTARAISILDNVQIDPSKL